MILNYPWHELVLYFFFYSFLGWAMETCYCSIKERRLVPRGFLHGPICPIYGCGVLLMVLLFTPLKGNILLFYITAVVVMTSWEYFVGWFLEVTTHVKYWDYSDEKFNLKGRVCLWVALVWGVLSYVVIFWIHPQVEKLYQRVPLLLAYILCGVLGSILVVDAAFTIRQLALISRLVVGVTVAGERLQVQLALGKAELSDKLADGKAELADKLADGKAELNRVLAESAANEKLENARAFYQEQVALLEKHSRRFRNSYKTLTANSRYRVSKEDIRAAAELAREARQKKKERRKAAR